MAQKPVLETLPADLPVNWTNQQFISPHGLEVGLTTQHGYNYLNQQINDAQVAINQINEGFSVLALDNVNVSVYGEHPASYVSDSVNKNYVISATSSSEQCITKSKIEIPNPWGDVARKIEIIANVQARIANDSTFSYHIGSHIYLVPSLTWDSSAKVVRSTLAGSTSKDHMGTVTLNWSDESSLKYPVSLWFKMYSEADVVDIMNWNMIVVQTKI